jgi:hypothetical protein
MGQGRRDGSPIIMGLECPRCKSIATTKSVTEEVNDTNQRRCGRRARSSVDDNKILGRLGLMLFRQLGYRVQFYTRAP